jgi:CDP-glucose 4,6-dehydratase
MVDRNAFWRGKTVLVTGHTGFKGGWLSLWLQSLGAEVVGYALPPATQPSLFACARVAEGMTSVTGDVRERDRLREVMRAHEPEVVFHLAAQALVKEAYRHPVETYATNVMGTAHVLDAARHTDSVRAVVSITSDKCYDNKEWVWGYRETDRLGGRDPYSSSKGCAEMVISAYRESYFSDDTADSSMAVASTRAGNVIGGGDWAPNRLLPDIVRAFEAGRSVEIRSPRATRPWQHVLAPLDGYLTLAEHLCEQGAAFAESWNFGPADREARPVSWIVERMKTLWGDGARWALDGKDHPHEDTHLKLDCSKARRRLGWLPKLPIENALEWIVEWYQAHYAGDEDMRALTEAQIDQYEMLAAPTSGDAHSVIPQKVKNAQ